MTGDVALFGPRVRQARIDKGLTQAQLGAALHLTQSAISRFEAAGFAPGVPMAALLAQRLDVSLDWLAGMSVHRQPADFYAQALAAVREHANFVLGSQS